MLHRHFCVLLYYFEFVVSFFVFLLIFCLVVFASKEFSFRIRITFSDTQLSLAPSTYQHLHVRCWLVGWSVGLLVCWSVTHFLLLESKGSRHHHQAFLIQSEFFNSVLLSKVYFCDMHPTCMSSKLCKFIPSPTRQKSEC